ncbi:MAG TPA: hypothetical protein VHL09_10320 [Dehalococcoidia bacterium]|nr:hypothetical protein [Dehalococcoidia bacterium]
MRDVLVPVYAALALTWDPATVGSLEDEIGPITHEQAEAAIVAEFARRFDLVEGTVSPEALDLAEQIEARHLSPG